jgi:transcriptional regulator with XRE-family HTH domain
MINGDKIRKIRKNRNMSLKQLAAATGLSISYISEIERCKKQPSLETIQVISDALNVSKEGLLTQQPQSIEPGKKIMLLRQSKNISLTELAKNTGISTAYLCQIEKGKVLPSISTLKDIADTLDTSVRELMASPCNIGYKLKKLRCERNMTQSELAKKADVSTGLIGQIENGKIEPSIKTLEKIAGAFCISPCYFVSEDDEIVSLFLPMKPETRELFLHPNVRSVLELLIDCSESELNFILNFIQLYKESHHSVN